MIFPDGFLWGSATAAIQIEGAAAADGKGPSVWDQFCRDHPEKIHLAATPETACDHYHRYREDAEQMARMGHNAYRFSISWPRLLPRGRGTVNRAGLDFYDRLLDELCARGISPNATLYHWDLPLPLALDGGWESPATVDAFVEFAQICFDRLSDRVDYWCTLNEPAWTLLNGYVTGLHPPCKHDLKAGVLASHHMMVAHHRAARACAGRGRVGMAVNLSPVYPATDREADIRAAERANGVLNYWFLEPLLSGRYPEETVRLYERRGLLPENLDLDPVPADFVGVNYYYPHYAVDAPPESNFHLNISGDRNEKCHFALADCFAFVANPEGRYTDWNWEIKPEALEELLLNLERRYPGTLMLVTENGIGLQDKLENGTVDDSPRIEFVREHLAAIHRAIQSGAKVGGYYMWALMDNFSWLNGYKKRYGFLYVDHQTLERTPKKSAAWFREVARANRLQ